MNLPSRWPTWVQSTQQFSWRSFETPSSPEGYKGTVPQLTQSTPDQPRLTGDVFQYSHGAYFLSTWSSRDWFCIVSAIMSVFTKITSQFLSLMKGSFGAVFHGCVPVDHFMWQQRASHRAWLWTCQNCPQSAREKGSRSKQGLWFCIGQLDLEACLLFWRHKCALVAFGVAF